MGTATNAKRKEKDILMFEDLKGKSVLVTGSSKGIGAAVAMAFGRHGARVAVHGFSSRPAAEQVVAEIRKDGGEAILVMGDVSRRDVAAEVVDKTVAAFGKIDVLVNNAGDLVKRMRLDEIDETTYDKVLDVNIRSVVFATQAAYPHFKKQGRGNVITTGSLAARNGGGNGSGLYAGSKAFVETFTRWLAFEYGQEGIRANCVSPGFVATNFHEVHTPRERWEIVAKSLPLRRVGKPEDISGAFLYLASDEASGWVTGQMIQINGGALMV